MESSPRCIVQWERYHAKQYKYRSFSFLWYDFPVEHLSLHHSLFLHFSVLLSLSFMFSLCHPSYLSSFYLSYICLPFFLPSFSISLFLFSLPFTSNLTLGRGAWLLLEHHHIRLTSSAPWLCEDATPTRQVYPDTIWKEYIKIACVSRRSQEQVDLMELARRPTPKSHGSWLLYSHKILLDPLDHQFGLLERI